MDNVFYSPPNILVIDDVNANLVVLSELIRKAGYIARPVNSVRQAVNAITAMPPNLILMDISMPEMNGFEFCAMLKKNVNTRDIPVIFISAFNASEDKIKGLEVGAVDYIAKPFEVKEVTLRINTHLKMYKMQQELEAYNKKLYKIINDQIRKIYEEQKNVIQALTILASKRNSSKARHLELIGKNSKALAVSLQLTPKYRDMITNSFIDAIELAAPLHDIGNISISDNILLKQLNLNDKEKEVIRKHPETGANILEVIYSLSEENELLKMAIDIARYHHEYWDGSGYPKGIRGTDIPLSARIVTVVDAYDTLVNETAERQAYSNESSIEIMNGYSGILFDPDIITIFNKIQHQLKK